jgi:signal transduction histidine kinase/ActR/RegA family two-component response regulator
MNQSTLTSTSTRSRALAETWYTLLQQQGRSALSDTVLRGEVERLAEALVKALQGTGSLNTVNPTAITLVGEQLVDLGIDGVETLVQVQNALTHWLTDFTTPDRIGSLLAAFNIGAYTALQQRTMQVEYQQRQQLEAQLELRTQLNGLLTRLNRELGHAGQMPMEAVGLTLGMVMREFAAESAGYFFWQSGRWVLKLAQAALPPKLFFTTDTSPRNFETPQHRLMNGQHQIAIPVVVGEERGLLLIVAEEWKLLGAEAALDHFALVGVALGNVLTTLQKQETYRPAPTAPLAPPRRHTGRLMGYLIDEQNHFNDLSEPPDMGTFYDPNNVSMQLDLPNEGVGHLVLESDHPFDEDETEVLNKVAELMAQAWERARLNKENESRSRQMQAAAEVSRAATSLLALDELLNKTVNEILRAFPNIYHAQVFLMDENNENAVLRASTGQAGRQLMSIRHSLPVGSASIVGRATGSGDYALIRDTDQSEEGIIWKPNQYLPETRAELAIPLRLGTRTIGTLDVQSKVVDAFNPSDIPVLQTMADQLATAIENARAYQQQIEAVDRLKELDSLKTTFLANMSHELRTPLNSIIGFSRLILKGIEGPLTERQHVDLETIHGSGQHLLGLIDTLLDHAKIEAGKMELDIEDVNLNHLIETVMRVANGLAKDKPLKLQSEVPSNLPTLRGDPVRIRQVLMNLLSNAIKFTEEGTVRLTVTPMRDEIMFSISDTGLGIPADKQDHLFDAFYQVDGSATRRVGGTGLGLAITKSFVEMHQGQLWVESRGIPGQGSTFSFLIPIEGPRLLDPEDADAPLVLGVDDELGMTLLYEKYLLSEGYRFIACNDPTLAAEQALRLKPNMILLDVRMPKLSGIKVVEQIRATPETAHIPIVMCTIEARQQVESDAFQAGANAVLQKPVSRQTLIRVVQQWTRTESIRS